jgi:hypothetical protein
MRDCSIPKLMDAIIRFYPEIECREYRKFREEDLVKGKTIFFNSLKGLLDLSQGCEAGTKFAGKVVAIE